MVQRVATGTLSGVQKERPDRGSNNFHKRLIIYVYVNKQASMLAVTSHSAGVAELKQRLEQADEELGRVKRQLEDRQGMQWPIQI